MSTLTEIEAAIARLPKDEFWSLTERLIALREDKWDAQIEEDARPGDPLDKLARKAIKDFEAERCKSVP